MDDIIAFAVNDAMCIVINLPICTGPVVNMVSDESEAPQNMKLELGAKLDIESGPSLGSLIHGLDLKTCLVHGSQ